MILLAGIGLGILSVANKILLLLSRKSGWMSGMAIGLLSGFYFWAIGLKILAIAELGFFVVMLYGYVRHVNPSKERMFQINLVMSALTLLLCFFLFAGYLTIIETISSLTFIWGGYLLSTAQKTLGWFCLLTAHITTATASFYSLQHIFAGLQIVSALVCAFALVTFVAKLPKVRGNPRPL